jgi:glycosyltransferase involved in cell wall biosynthesis
MTHPGTRLPNVLFAIGGLGSGGSEGQLVELLARTHGVALQASLVTFQDVVAARHAERLREAGVPHHRMPRPRGNRGLRAAALVPHVVRLLRRVRPDVIYTWLEESALYLAPFARLERVPLMVARRNVCGSRAERFIVGRAAIRTAERSASLVTANSAAGAVEARRRGIRAERIRTIPNGHILVDPLPMPADDVVRLGCVAQFRPEKGHLRLLEVLSRMSTQHEWTLDLAGEGSMKAELAREAKVRGLEDRVHFLGQVDDVRGFWSEEHIAVLLSDTEGSPNALIEAAFAGRPMVGTATGGTPDVIGDDAGFVVSLDDHDAGAQAVQRLIEDGALRQRLGQAAHARAARCFDMDRFVEGHLSAIREVCP